MKIRNIVRLASFGLCLVAVLAAYAVIGANETKTYKARLEAGYQQNLTELSECLNSIETNLIKSQYTAGGAVMQDLSEDLYSECSTAKNALSRLPIEQLNLSGTYKFLSQAGDYAAYLAEKMTANEEISDEEYENLQKLLKYAGEYADCVDDMVAICAAGGKITDNEVKSSSTSASVSSLSINFDSAEEIFSDYPTLLYDGPFADAVLNKESEMINEADEVSKSYAQSIAAAALGADSDSLSYSGDENGSLPCYDFSYGNYTVAVTKNGGYIAYIICSSAVSERTISEENAVNLAKSYLEQIGYSGMSESYYAASGNVCTINFAYEKSNVTYYADLIKVGISMSDGSIYSLEAEGFLTNHTDRGKFKSSLSLSEAQENLSTHVSVLAGKKCVIPKTDGTEVQCYEFYAKSTDSDDEMLIYVNAKTGEEEELLLLMYSDDGTFTK
ncbi:MAG: germination protein YpeB [Clostridiales bacterium]|nr:germination protein YpeB [Clostridiales bacterium]